MTEDHLLTTVLIGYAIFAAFWYVRVGLRANVPDPDDDRFTRAANARDRGASGVPDFVVAGALLATAAALLVHLFTVAVAYAILCLVLATRVVVNLLVEERERAKRRRAALLQRSPRIDGILAAWIGLAATSIALLLPSLAGSDRTVALVVAACALAMVVVAWRIATATRLLTGDDVEAELLVDRTRRIRRTGLVCMIAIGSVFFCSVVTREPQNFGYTGIFVWAMLGVWMIVYLRRLYRTPLPS